MYFKSIANLRYIKVIEFFINEYVSIKTINTVLKYKMSTRKIFNDNLKSLLIVGFFSLVQIAYSQDLIGGIGSFLDDTTFNADWYNETEGNGTFSTSTTYPYYGSASLKVDVNTDSPSQVRMFNKATSYFPMTNGEVFTVSFYAKGTVGNEFTVTLMDTSANVETINQEIKLDEWTFYTLALPSNVTTNNGRIKLNFLNEGTYEIDELIIKSGGFNTWYISPTGTNSISGNNGLNASQPLQTINYAINNAWSSGDIIYVMNGTYQNTGYGNGELNNGSVVSVNKEGALNGPLVIRNYPGHSPKIEFDGAGGFVCGTGKYLEISGFEIQGQNQQITYNEANSYRLIPNNYYKGRGITVWASGGGHHIILHSNKVYDCPGSGIRINNSDYCTITNNEVYNCTLWTSSGSSAVVLAQSKSIDNDLKIKMRITKNKVYNNINKIHYFNSTYTCSDPTAYGCEDYPNIIDGSGCYITRNNDRGTGKADENPNGQYKGYFYFANNIAYGNGINGLVVHKSDYSIVMNNTIYLNGAVPLSEGRQAAGGITVNNSVEVRIYNNISWVRLDTDYAYRVFGATSNVKGKNNIMYNTELSNAGGLTNMLNVDPQYVDKDNFDFKLSEGSPAIDAGILESNILLLPNDTSGYEYIPPYDFENNTRALTVSDIGAFESVDLGSLGIDDDIDKITKQLYLYPNPATNIVMISGITSNDTISVYDLLGNQYLFIKNPNIQSNKTILNINQLRAGLYLVKISTNNTFKTIKLIKR